MTDLKDLPARHANPKRPKRFRSHVTDQTLHGDHGPLRGTRVRLTAIAENALDRTRSTGDSCSSLYPTPREKVKRRAFSRRACTARTPRRASTAGPRSEPSVAT